MRYSGRRNWSLGPQSWTAIICAPDFVEIFSVSCPLKFCKIEPLTWSVVIFTNGTKIIGIKSEITKSEPLKNIVEA